MSSSEDSIETGEISKEPLGDSVIDDVEEKKGFFQKWKDKKAAEAAQPKVSYGTLFRYTNGIDYLFMIFGTIGALAHGAILPLFALIFGELIDAFTLPPDELFEEITKVALYFLYAGVGAFAVTYAQNAFWAMIGHRQIEKIRTEYINAILRQEIGWFDTQDTGELTARISGDTVLVQEAMGLKIGSALQFLATFLGGFILGFIQGWKMTLVILAISPLLAAGAAFMGVTMASLTNQGQKAYAKAGAVATEVIGGIRTVAAFGAENQEYKRYTVNLEEARKLGNRRGFVSGFGLGMTLFIMFGSYGLALWYGSELVIDGDMTGGEVLTVFFSVLIGAFSLGQMGPSVEAIGKGRGAAYVIFDTIDRQSLIDPFTDEGKKLDKVIGKIELRSVHFHYPTRPEVKVLQGFSLRVEPGQTVALVGESGAGKSSTVQLIQRFYDPEEGSVLVDGKDISKLNTKWWRQQLGLVSQEPVLFSGTIADNIELGKPGASREEIEEAAKSANAHNFISKFPKGYDTPVGEKGAQMSGGQKQRIAIARAIVRNPKILLLDEATSALDTESEKIVQEALDAVKLGRTTIVVAHRLSTIRDADLICVLSKGKIAEKGTHDELMASGTLYPELVRAQQGEQKEKKEVSKVVRIDKKTSEAIHHADKKEGEEEEKEKSVSLRRIYSLNFSEWPYLLLGLIASIITGGINPVFAIVFSEMIGLYFKPHDEIRSEAPLWSLLFVGIGLAMLIFQGLQIWMFTVAGEHLTARLRRMTFKAILNQPPSWFDTENHSTGVLTSRLSRDTTLVEGLVGSRLGLTVQNVVTVTAGVVIAFIFGWKLTLVILAASPAIVFSNGMEMLSMTGFAKLSQKANEAANQIATEAISNMRTVAAFTQEGQILADYTSQLRRPTVLGLRRANITGFLLGLGELFLFCTYTLGFWYGGKLTADGEMDFTDVMKVFMAIMLSAMSIGQTAAMSPDGTKAKAAAAAIFHIIDDEPEYSPFSEEGRVPKKVKGSLKLSKLQFSYPTRQEVPVLRKLTLSAKPGQVVALVGQSGCGKSSTVSLIERFYDPSGGKLSMDGVDIRKLNLRWFRQQMGLVSQEPVLFSGTIAQNISYGKPDASREEIEEAAKSANAHNFISKFPKGYDTPVGEKGAQMSGGQKQRIAIARAIIRNPKILLLDEATSALDTESEKIVQEALDAAMEGRTTIVIAHRLSTIRNADVICVIENGRVAEQGTHNQLMELGGAYSKLVTRQMA